MLNPIIWWLAAAAVYPILTVFAVDSNGDASPTTGVTTTDPIVTNVDVPLPSNTQPCNGQLEFCTRSYGNITYVGAHNSPFVMENNIAANNNFDVTVQLDDGIRMRTSMILWLIDINANLTQQQFRDRPIRLMAPYSIAIPGNFRRRC